MPEWPVVPGADYRYGFPVVGLFMPYVVMMLDRLGDEQAAGLLEQLEAAAFRAVVLHDLEELPCVSW